MQRSVHEMMEYPHDEHYDMLLTVCTRNSLCGTRARIYAPPYRTLIYLDECCKVSVAHGNTVLLITDYWRTVHSAATDGAIIAGVERELCSSSRDIVREFGLSQPRVL
jgi:hypothetical protein